MSRSTDNYKQVQEESKVEASRKGQFLMKPPDDLRDLLEIVNAIPKKSNVIRDKHSLEVALNDADNVFREFVAPRGLQTEENVEEAIRRWREADAWYGALFSIDFLPHIEKVPFSFGEVSLTIECDEQGFIRLKENLFTRAFGEKGGIEAARIGKCKNCLKIFWKGRKDQLCCSTSCSKAVRNRRWREKSADYEFNRYNKNNQKENK